MANIRARLPDMDGVSLTIPHGDIPVKDTDGTTVGWVTSWETVGDHAYANIDIQGFFFDGYDAEMAGILSHISLKPRAD